MQSKNFNHWAPVVTASYRRESQGVVILSNMKSETINLWDNIFKNEGSRKPNGPELQHSDNSPCSLDTVYSKVKKVSWK